LIFLRAPKERHMLPKKPDCMVIDCPKKRISRKAEKFENQIGIAPRSQNLFADFFHFFKERLAKSS
jgi:hypothetical protein